VKVGDTKRSFVHDVPDDFTLNKIELLAVKFAILGAGEQEALITTQSMYVSDMLAKDGDAWAKNPKSNAELITEIRDLLTSSKKIEIVYEKSEDAKSLCVS